MQIKNYLDADYWYQMYGSQSVGLPLVKKDGFAADMLNFAPNEKTSLHTHEGDHILFGVEGSGWIDCGASNSITNSSWYVQLRSKCRDL